METKPLTVILDAALVRELKGFCVSKGASLKKVTGASLQIMLAAQGSKKVKRPPCEHKEDICWGTCGNNPTTL